MYRYNIDTTNEDLIQIDLNDSWTISDGETALLTLVRFENPKDKNLSLIICKKDLLSLRDSLNKILENK